MTDRLPSRYTNRLRRLLDQQRDAISTLQTDLDTAEAAIAALSGATLELIDADYFTLDGATGENLAIPTDLGQIVIRICNKAAMGGGTHTITFLTNDLQMPVGGGTKATIATTGAGSYLVLLSAYIGDVYCWYALHYAGWS